jgi:hypothetical protein
MSTFKVKPSKPMAVFGAVFGVAILVFGFVSGVGRGTGFIRLWLAAGVAIIAFTLWAVLPGRPWRCPGAALAPGHRALLYQV